MKHLLAGPRLSLCALFTLTATGLSAPASVWEDTYAELLQSYVRDGQVDYQDWHQNQNDLHRLGAVALGILQADPSSMNPREQLAFYLNAYNAWILKTVLDHYPVKSIKDTMLFVFRRDIIKVAGRTLSFSDLENEIIREQFADPRVHFALNCASTSCPPLHSQPFRASTLDATLDALTQAFIRSPLGLRRLNPQDIAVSKIFKWYREDFTPNDQTLLDYLNAYLPRPLPPATEIRFLPYDWSLNRTP